MAILRFALSAVLVWAPLLASAGKHEGHKKHGKHDVDPLVQKAGPPSLRCPKGFQPHGDHKNMQCVRAIERAPVAACPLGGVLQGDKCKIIAPVEMICPPGFAPSDSGHKHGDSKHHGGGKHGGDDLVCLKVKTARPVAVCPNGKPTPNGLCPFVERSPADFECPGDSGKKHGRGHKDKGHGLGGSHPGQCFALRETPKLPVCPPGLMLKKGMCIGQRKTVCPLPTFGKKGVSHGKSGYDGHSHGAHLGGYHNGRDHGPQGFLPAGDEVYDLDVNHPDARDVTIPVSSFESGVVDLDISVRRLGKAKKHGHGYSPVQAVTPKLGCTENYAAPPEFVCPSDAIQSGKKHKKDNHGCFVALPIPPVPYCPTPDARLSKDGRHCVVHGAEAALLRCPAGFNECGGGKKHKHGGGKKHGDDFACCASKHAPPVPQCPHGFTLHGHKCVTYRHHELMCPAGKMHGHTCLIKEKIAPIVEFTVTQKSHAPPVPFKK